VISGNGAKENKPFDLEERTLKYTKDVIALINSCPKTVVNHELFGQLIRSAGSVGANYIEAREAFSKKDFSLRIKICQKEAKESAYWLKLIETKNDDEQKRQSLIIETNELLRIFSSIVEKMKEKAIK
jgi:four helix bundle protein